MFLTRFSFFTKVTNFKQNDSCAECFDANFEQLDRCAQCFGQVLACYLKTPSSSCFDANFEQQDSCAQSLGQVLAFQQKSPNSRKTTSCAQCFDATFGQQDSCARSFGQVSACYQKTPSSSKSTVAQSVLTPISSIRTVAQFFDVANFQCFDAASGQQDSCARCFGQVLACYQKTPSSSKSKVAHSVLTPISSNRTVVDVFMTSFSLLTKVAKFKKNDSSAQCFDAAFGH